MSQKVNGNVNGKSEANFEENQRKYEWKDETVEKLKTFRQEQTILDNINHLHYTNKTKRNASVEKIQEGFAESGLINLPSANIVQKKFPFITSFVASVFFFFRFIVGTCERFR